MRLLYNFSIHAYRLGILLASPFIPKAKKWIAGRKDIFKSLEEKIKPGEKIIWFHCASLGEFEQGRPLIEKFRVSGSGFRVLLTFFSPSGYEIRKNYEGADHIFYLPADTPFNAKRFIDIVKPTIAFFIKYEFWFNYLNELKHRSTPTFLVSGILREDHYFFSWYGGYFKKQLNCFTHFFLQDENSKKLLEKSGYTNTTVSGGTRFDRVFEIKERAKKIELVEKFKGDSLLLIGGSTWEEDEKLLSRFKVQSSKFKVIIAPHEIGQSHIRSIEQKFSDRSVVRYSSASLGNVADKEVLIVDTIGILSSLYQYGHIAFIGGGFGKGIHNILEASTYGLPVIFGPNYHKFKEAKDLIQLGGGFCVSTENKLSEKLTRLLNENELYKKASSIAQQYVIDNTGATETIYNSIKNYL